MLVKRVNELDGERGEPRFLCWVPHAVISQNGGLLAKRVWKEERNNKFNSNVLYVNENLERFILEVRVHK